MQQVAKIPKGLGDLSAPGRGRNRAAPEAKAISGFFVNCTRTEHEQLEPRSGGSAGESFFQDQEQARKSLSNMSEERSNKEQMKGRDRVRALWSQVEEFPIGTV